MINYVIEIVLFSRILRLKLVPNSLSSNDRRNFKNNYSLTNKQKILNKKKSFS